MRILIVGAGALGGYFGARLLDAGQDVTFLVRARRAAQLEQDGLNVKSPAGDLHIANPPHVMAETLTKPFDVIIVGCKAFDLDSTMAGFAPAVGPQTTIVPILNGMAHLDRLAKRFGAERVVGGTCFISATLDSHGTVRHLNDVHVLSFGELDGSKSARIQALAEACAAAKFDSRPTETIVQQMWEKWTFLATLAASTCLFRATIGDILNAPQGELLLTTMVQEAEAIASAAGHAPRPDVFQPMRSSLFRPGSPMTASMMRDIQNSAQTEADHIIGDLILRGAAAKPAAVPAPLMTVAYNHLKAYDARRIREGD